MSCGCPPGYTYNEEINLCERTIIEDAVVRSNPLLPFKACTSVKNMWRGTAIYGPISPSQFPLIGRNNVNPEFEDASEQTVSPEAVLISGALWTGGDLARGRMNQVAVGLLPPKGAWHGYVRCITVKEGEEHSVAVASTYGFRVYVDGEVAIVYTPSFPTRPEEFLHVFRLNLPEGDHTIVCEGRSGGPVTNCIDQYQGAVNCNSSSAVALSDPCPNLGNLVFEMYRNITPQILSDAKNQYDLNELYTKSYVNGVGQFVSTVLLAGTPFDSGLNGTYSCQTGVLNRCFEDKMYCEYVDQTPKVPCCFNLINCSTGAIIVTNTDLDAYLGKVISIAEQPGCYLININSAENCPGAIAVTVETTFVSCADCAQIYYKLVDCRGEADPIVTTTDISAHIDKIVRIAGYNVCWNVVIGERVSNPKGVIVVSSFDTCTSCL